MSVWDDRVPYAASPAHWKGLRGAMYAVWATVPVPPGAESIANGDGGTSAADKAADGAADGGVPGSPMTVGGAALSFYEAYGTVWVTVDGPDGYAEFQLRGGAWRYAATSPILFAPYDGGDCFDDLDPVEIAKVVSILPPPTIADAVDQWAERQEGAG